MQENKLRKFRKVLKSLSWYLTRSFLAYCVLGGSYGGFSGKPELRQVESHIMVVHFPIIAVTWPVWFGFVLVIIAGIMGGAKNRHQSAVED